MAVNTVTCTTQVKNSGYSEYEACVFSVLKIQDPLQRCPLRTHDFSFLVGLDGNFRAQNIWTVQRCMGTNSLIIKTTVHPYAGVQQHHDTGPAADITNMVPVLSALKPP
jgi:hypothetical protein